MRTIYTDGDGGGTIRESSALPIGWRERSHTSIATERSPEPHSVVDTPLADIHIPGVSIIGKTVSPTVSVPYGQWLGRRKVEHLVLCTVVEDERQVVSLRLRKVNQLTHGPKGVRN